MRLSTLTFTLTMLLSSSLAYASACDTEDKIHALALNMYHEARGEGSDAMQMVGEVTLNRAGNNLFPSTICDVVYQAKTDSNGNPLRGKCQFSWYCDGTHRVRPIYQPLYNESAEVAKKVLLEGFRLPSLKNAMYYHADYVQPGWGKKPITKIGRHIFYGS